MSSTLDDVQSEGGDSNTLSLDSDCLFLDRDLQNTSHAPDHQLPETYPPSEPTQRRHPVFFFEDDLIELLVEDVRFKIHAHLFSRQSEKARSFIQSFQNRTILVENVRATDFERFLTILYSRSHDSIALHTKADWTAVLALSTLWDFASIRFWAIRELLDLTTPVDRLVLARDFAVNEWRADAFLNVCLAPSWPSDDDCRRLGMETMIKVGCAREALRTPGQLVPSAQHATIIANVFDISAGDSVHEQSTGHLATSNASSPSGTIPDFDAGLERQDADCSLVLYMRELVQARRWESLYAPYSTHKDVSVLHSEIDKTQKWMDSAEYQGVSASEIKAQHMHLESLARTIIERYQEAKDRAVAVSQLQQDIRLYGAKAGYARSNAEIALHQLEALLDDKLFLKAQCDEATRWLDRVLADQQRLPKYEEPVLTAQMVLQRKQELAELASFVFK